MYPYGWLVYLYEWVVYTVKERSLGLLTVYGVLVYPKYSRVCRVTNYLMYLDKCVVYLCRHLVNFVLGKSAMPKASYIIALPEVASVYKMLAYPIRWLI